MSKAETIERGEVWQALPDRFDIRDLADAVRARSPFVTGAVAQGVARSLGDDFLGMDMVRRVRGGETYQFEKL